MNQEKWKVLVIDDEEGIRRVMSIALTDEGYEVLTAEDGENGIQLCRQASPHISAPSHKPFQGQRYCGKTGSIFHAAIGLNAEICGNQEMESLGAQVQ